MEQTSRRAGGGAGARDADGGGNETLYQYENENQCRILPEKQSVTDPIVDGFPLFVRSYCLFDTGRRARDSSGGCSGVWSVASGGGIIIAPLSI